MTKEPLSNWASLILEKSYDKEVTQKQLTQNKIKKYKIEISQPYFKWLDDKRILVN